MKICMSAKWFPLRILARYKELSQQTGKLNDQELLKESVKAIDSDQIKVDQYADPEKVGSLHFSPTSYVLLTCLIELFMNFQMEAEKKARLEKQKVLQRLIKMSEEQEVRETELANAPPPPTKRRASSSS